MLHLRQALDLLMKLLMLDMICIDFKKSMCNVYDFFVTKMGIIVYKDGQVSFTYRNLKYGQIAYRLDFQRTTNNRG